jgi:hypothetical protein
MRVRIRVTAIDAIDASIWTVVVGAVCWIAGWRDLSAGVVLVGTFLSVLAYAWVSGVADSLNDDVQEDAPYAQCVVCRAFRSLAQLDADGTCVDGCDERQAA